MLIHGEYGKGIESMNLKQAPKLIHRGFIKESDDFYCKIPLRIRTAIFTKISGKNGNAIKLILYLIENQGNGSFRVTEKDVEVKTGMNEKSYRRARQFLIDLGWITHDKGMITVNIDKIE